MKTFSIFAGKTKIVAYATIIICLTKIIVNVFTRGFLDIFNIVRLVCAILALMIFMENKEKDLVKFEKYDQSDVSALSSLRQKCWQETYEGIYPFQDIFNFDYNAHQEKFALYLYKGYECYKILCRQATIGYLIFCVKDDDAVKAARLNSLYILRAYQKQGIGKTALGILTDFCLRQGIDKIYIECNYHNKNALAFYQRMGGKIIAQDINNGSKQQDQVSMVICCAKKPRL